MPIFADGSVCQVAPIGAVLFLFVRIAAHLPEPKPGAGGVVSAGRGGVPAADGRRSLRSLLCVPVLVALVGGFNFLFAHWGVTVLFSRGDTQFTLESLIYGCFQGGIFAGVVLWLAVFGRVLGSDRLLAVTGRAAPRFSLLFSMTLGCIARFRENARQIRLARAGAGLAKEKPLHEALDQFSTLVTLSLEGSMTTADAMRARGYGKGRRRVYDPFTFGVADGRGAPAEYHGAGGGAHRRPCFLF